MIENVNIIKIDNGKLSYTNINCYDDIKVVNIKEYLEIMRIENLVNYCHNIKVECAELIPYLIKNGFKNNVKGRLKRKEFRKVESEDGSVFELRFNYKGTNIKIYDSQKILNFNIEDLKNDFLHLKNIELQDLTIVAKSLKIMFEKGYTKKTMSGNAYDIWKKGMFTENGEINQIKLNNIIPKLDIKVDDFIRKSYKGGWTYLNRHYDKNKKSGFTFDVNSLYPYVMYTQLLPWGEPIEFYGKYKKDKEYPLYIQEVRFDYLSLKKKKVPCANGKGIGQLIEQKFIENESNITMCITNIDLELIKKSYDYGKIEYFKGYKFRATKKLFTKYIDYFMKIKENSTGTERQIAKLFLNSLYGKFASKVKRPIYETKLDEDGVEVRDIVGYDKNGQMYYTPLSCFISSYARTITINAANKNYKYFIYADTDSIHLNCKKISKVKGIKIHDKKLGCWKLEKVFSDSVFIGSKCYGEYDENGWEFKVAGLPKSACDKIKDKSQFYSGSEIQCKVRVKSVNGTEMIDRKFVIGANVIGEIY